MTTARVRLALVGLTGVLIAVSLGGCTYRDSSEIPTPWSTAHTFVESSWFTDQASTYVEKGDLETAETFLKKAEIRVTGWGGPSVVGDPGDLDELTDTYVALQVQRTRALRREIEARRTGDKQTASAEKKRGRSLEAQAGQLMKNADFDDLSHGDVTDREFWKEFHLQKARHDRRLAPRILRESRQQRQ